MTIALPTEQALRELGNFEERVRSRVVGHNPWYRWIKRRADSRKVSDLGDSLRVRISTGVPYLWSVFNTEGDADRYGAMASVVGLIREFPKHVSRLYNQVLDYVAGFKGDHAVQINEFVREYGLQVGDQIEKEFPFAEVVSSIEALEHLVRDAMVEDETKKARLIRGLKIIKGNYAPGKTVEELKKVFDRDERLASLRLAKSDMQTWGAVR